MPAHTTAEAVASARESLRLAAVHGDFSRFDQDDARTLAGMLDEIEDLRTRIADDGVRTIPDDCKPEMPGPVLPWAGRATHALHD